MSLDDTYKELQTFDAALRRFHEALRSAERSLKSSHDRVDPLWRDSFRRDYDRRWREFGENLDGYMKHSADSYERFIAEKRQHLGRFLNG